MQTNVLTLLVLYALAWGYLTYTKGGRTIYAVGSNREAARTAGLDVLFYSVLPYVVSGALSAIAATLMSAQILSIDPLAGTGLELDAIAAVVIGGASLYGGRGTIIGTLIGVFIMVMIRNGLNLLGVSPFWQGSAIGGDHHRRGSGRTAPEPARRGARRRQNEEGEDDDRGAVARHPPLWNRPTGDAAARAERRPAVRGARSGKSCATSASAAWR